MDIQESNKLIAEFMGREFLNTGSCYYDETGTAIGSELKYYTSRDWLIPVVQKINELDNTEFPPDLYGRWLYLVTLPIYTPIETVYHSTVNFIKWYNTNNES